MKNMLLKELVLDSAEEIVELITLSKMKVNCRVERGMSTQTVDCIITVDTSAIAFTVRHENNFIHFEFTGDDEIINFEIADNDLTDLVIR